MTWLLISSPTLPAAAAPASTAAFTLPTSPLTIVVTYAPPIWIVLTMLDVGGLAHGVGRFDQADPAFGFDQAERA